MDREHLHRLGVGLQPAAALLVAGVARRPRRSAVRSHAVSAVAPSCSSVDGGVQQLADVAQVGQPPLAVGVASSRAGRPCVDA